MSYLSTSLAVPWRSWRSAIELIIMRLTIRLAASLVASVSLLAFVFAYFQVENERRSLHDLEKRAVVAVIHDSGELEAQVRQHSRDLVLRSVLQALLITLLTLLIVRWCVAGSVARTVQWMHEVRMGRRTPHPATEPELLQPFHTEVGHFANSLLAARAAAAEEARLRDAAESLWTPERLRINVQNRLSGSRLFVLSNREPYSHQRHGKNIEVVVPPSGLVTAIEPILRACDGVWVAHGSGDADRETVDSHDRLRVPPEEAHNYTLRRVWLTPEEEAGYYFGFSNEGLWPLCHIAHTRPTFRPQDWLQYHSVNEKFSRALLREMDGVPEPLVLVQDYHFALVPRMIKESRPDARVAIFWHIPWPNPEAFGICPQQRELLDGLLGADLIGFHIQAHCMNFLGTVDRALESRVELERSGVNRGGHLTLVRPFPISIPFPQSTDEAEPSDARCERATLLKDLGIEADFIGVGVDRVDYTKGILERFHGIEELLEHNPQYRGHLAFLQVGAPSRMNVRSYQDLFAEVGREAERINERWARGRWRPIVLLDRYHTHREIDRFFRAADFCLVTSLHDGMNLVAKEFVAARDDEQGVLILSTFTGASRELTDALLVNPYDASQLAAAMCVAMEMPPEERAARMRRMRRVVRENNVYRWAANLIGELAEIRPTLHPEGHSDLRPELGGNSSGIGLRIGNAPQGAAA
jgi:trehalose-6-phosphate synthase